MDFLKKALTIAILVGVVAVALNDAGRFADAKYYLARSTQETADYAAGIAREGTTIAGGKAADFARARGIELYGYVQDNDNVHVWTRTTVEGTWVFAALSAFAAHERADAPLVMEDQTISYIR